jgi:hypothetical protein
MRRYELIFRCKIPPHTELCLERLLSEPLIHLIYMKKDD